MSKINDRTLYYCGCSNPSADIVDRAERFVSAASLQNALRGKVQSEKFKQARRQDSAKWFTPARAVNGIGKLWLDHFRDYAGDKCLLFPFRTAAHPRGKVTYNFKQMPAHRAMCLMANGLPKTEKKAMALHSCGNGHLGCVNPNHLYWGDAADNGKDRSVHAGNGKSVAKDSPTSPMESERKKQAKKAA